MDTWQYAQLMVTCNRRVATGADGWTITWYGPDVTAESGTKSYEDVVRKLNGVGEKGWELVDVAALNGGGTGHVSLKEDWSLTRYTFRRSSSMANREPTLTAERS
jgi:carbohydrate-binding DOMON domain-containing protein